jgi:hypothetical protein
VIREGNSKYQSRDQNKDSQRESQNNGQRNDYIKDQRKNQSEDQSKEEQSRSQRGEQNGDQRRETNGDHRSVQIIESSKDFRGEQNRDQKKAQNNGLSKILYREEKKRSSCDRHKEQKSEPLPKREKPGRPHSIKTYEKKRANEDAEVLVVKESKSEMNQGEAVGKMTTEAERNSLPGRFSKRRQKNDYGQIKASSTNANRRFADQQ